MNTIVDRISQIANYKEITIGGLERKIGASKGVLSRAIANNTDIQSKWITIIVENYPDINSEWLLTGKGDMLRTTAAGNIPAAAKSGKTAPLSSCQELPLIPIDAVAGWCGIDMPGITIANCESYTIPEFIQAGAEFLIRVSGSSMYPKYSSGDILACRRIIKVTFIQWGKIYVIDSQQGAMVKRLFEDKEHPDSIICKSDNEKYPPFTLPKSEIRSWSIVIGAVRLE